VNKVTVRLRDLVALDPLILTYPKGKEFIVDVLDGRSQSPLRVIFTVNREGATAATNMWPHRLPNPSVGNPTTETLTKICPVITVVTKVTFSSRANNP
jgi:hypothetical protein